MSSEILVGKPEVLAVAFARRCTAEAERALVARGRFAIAVCGGSVAETFFPSLAAARLDWSRVDVFWTDERAVAADDPASNFGLARRLWLDPAAVPAGRRHPMPAASPNLTAAAAEYAAELARVAGSPARLDLALLGVGEDGHVASLFPGHPGVGSSAPVVAVEDSPKPPPRRLSLSLGTLARADLVVVAAFGAAKAPVLAAALAAPGSELPLAALLRRAARSLLLLDPDAAASLPTDLRASRAALSS